MSLNKYCFAYHVKDGKPSCNALNEIDCTKCTFYKKRKEIKNNPFYAYSFKDKKELEILKNKLNIKDEDIIK